MTDGLSLERRIADLLASGEPDDPARAALAELHALYAAHLARLDEIVSISENFPIAQPSQQDLETRYERQFLRLERFVKVSERYQTMLREAFEALRVSESRFRSLASASSEAVWTAGPEGEGARGEGGWGAIGAAYGTVEDWLAGVSDADRDRVAAEWARTVEWQTALEIEHGALGDCDDPRVIVTRAIPVRDETGAVIEWVGMCTDVTRERQAEAERAERERLADRLEQFSVVTTTLEHEINNPMAIVLGNLQILARSPDLGEADHGRVAVAADSAKRVGDLVRSLRTLKDLREASTGGVTVLDLTPVDGDSRG